MVTWGEAIAALNNTATDIHNTLKNILTQLGAEPGEPPVPIIPIISNFPRSNKKELVADGITTIDTRTGKAILNDTSVESLSASIPDDLCRSILIDINAKIDLTLFEGDKTSLAASVYPGKHRFHSILFDRIKIKTTAVTTIQLFISNVESPTIEDTASSTNRPTFYTNTQTVTAHGTAIQLPTKSIPSGYSVVVKAKRANTGYIYPGESKAQAEAHNYELDSKESISLQVTNVNAIWIDSSVDAEGVEIIVEAEE